MASPFPLIAVLRDQRLPEAPLLPVVEEAPHAIRVENIGGGECLAVCACGWIGLPTSSVDGAEETCPIAGEQTRLSSGHAEHGAAEPAPASSRIAGEASGEGRPRC